MKTAGREAGLLKMSELVEASGVPAATIKHYLREDLLPEPIKTSRNMAWYRPETVERIEVIKRLQEERFMPLKAIRHVLAEDPGQAKALLFEQDTGAQQLAGTRLLAGRQSKLQLPLLGGLVEPAVALRDVAAVPGPVHRLRQQQGCLHVAGEVGPPTEKPSEVGCNCVNHDSTCGARGDLVGEGRQRGDGG